MHPFPQIKEPTRVISGFSCEDVLQNVSKELLLLTA